jgi:hypothetical protein
MPTFKAPLYTKITNSKTGAQEPCYIFNIEFNNCDYLSFIADSQSDISLQSLQKCVLENISWWNDFIQQYLQASVKYFTKPYTVEQINKITKHTLDGINTLPFPNNVVLVPKSIKICGGVFTVNWTYNTEAMIDIPDVEDTENTKNSIIESISLPVSNNDKLLNGIEELNIDELPVEDASTDAPLELDSPAKFYEKQKIKEARLKAKLAIYKAQRQMTQYYEKYGDDISDSDSDLETSDDDSGEDSGNEEVQL